MKRKEKLPSISQMLEEIKSIEKENFIIDRILYGLTALDEYVTVSEEEQIIVDNFKKMIENKNSINTINSIALSKGVINADRENNERIEWASFGEFVSIANKHSDWKSAYVEAQKVKNVSESTANLFYKKFNPKGVMSSEESFRYFYNEVMKNETIKYFEQKKEREAY